MVFPCRKRRKGRFFGEKHVFSWKKTAPRPGLEPPSCSHFTFSGRRPPVFLAIGFKKHLTFYQTFLCSIKTYVPRSPLSGLGWTIELLNYWTIELNWSWSFQDWTIEPIVLIPQGSCACQRAPGGRKMKTCMQHTNPVEATGLFVCSAATTG